MLIKTYQPLKFNSFFQMFEKNKIVTTSTNDNKGYTKL